MSPRAASRLEAFGFRDVYDYAPGKVDWMACGLPVEDRDEKTLSLVDVLNSEVPTCALNDRLFDMDKSEVDSRPRVVINEANVVLGVVDQDNSSGCKGARAEEIMDPAPVTFRANTTVDRAAAYMSKNDRRWLVVTTSDGQLLGIVGRQIVEHTVNETGPQM